MTSVQHISGGELVEDVGEFFAPVSSDLIDGLLGQYNALRTRITALAAAVREDQCAGVLHYFIEGNVEEQRLSLPKTVDRLFSVDGAIAQLNAEYWDRTLRLTDVLDCMPQARRDKWYEQIRQPLGKKRDKYDSEYIVQPLPEFTEDTVRTTLGALMNSRAKFFAERVDGLFRSLSKEHVTNCPQGFNKRMILLRAISSFGTVEHGTAGVINDLRCVIAKFMGRDEPKWGATSQVIAIARKDNGQWLNVDGGALRIRVYNGVGTAHLEVHPDMAWRLNAVLASLYPAAIPSEFRTKPKRARKIKDFALYDRPLPFAVLEVLAGMKPGYRLRENPGFRESKFIDIPKTLRFDHSERSKAVEDEAIRVLEALGGVYEKPHNIGHWRFDYEPSGVLDEVISSGCLPDRKAHQFYPTPVALAEKAVGQALQGAAAGMTWLEPSAGQGGLADLMPAPTCIEVSALHCQILKAKGHHVIEGDFLTFAGAAFDRIVMNPPFSEGRWQAHIEHAASLLHPAGRLVAILPSSAKNKPVLGKDFDHQWSPIYPDQFPGAAVDVVILTAQRKSA